MDILSAASAAHKQKIATTDPWYVLLTVWPDTVNAPSTVLRLVRNPDDLTYKGNTYLAFSFDFDVLWDKASGELQSVKLTVSNVGRTLEGYLAQYSGGVNAQVQIDVVSAEDLQGDPAQTYVFGVQQADADATWVTFTLGGINPMLRQFPRFLYFANYCPWVFNAPALQATADPRGAQCGYWGTSTSCDHTLNGANGCSFHNNSLRYGGCPGVGTQGLVPVSPT